VSNLRTYNSKTYLCHCTHAPALLWLCSRPRCHTCQTCFNFLRLVRADESALHFKSAVRANKCLSSCQKSARTFVLHTSWPKTKIENFGANQSFPNAVVYGNLFDQWMRSLILVAFILQTAVAELMSNSVSPWHPT